MKVLALADRRPYPPLEEILKKYAHELDLVITLGDLDFYDLQALGHYPDLPKIGVYGNHCAGSYMNSLGIVNLHNSYVKIKDKVFIGMEGCPRYKKGPFQYSQAEADAIITAWPKADVVISHTPPFGVHDDANDLEKTSHHGWHSLRDYVEDNQPWAVLHGHTHPEEETTLVGLTEVNHVWRYRILDL